MVAGCLKNGVRTICPLLGDGSESTYCAKDAHEAEEDLLQMVTYNYALRAAYEVRLSIACDL